MRNGTGQGMIMDLVDVYDAHVSERPYKKAFSHGEAVQIIQEVYVNSLPPF
jgi:putative two-component system response regulator